MGDFLIALTVIAGLSGVLGALVLIARRVRRRGAAGPAIAAAMAAFDEGWNTTAYARHVELRAQDERTSEAGDADDL